MPKTNERSLQMEQKYTLIEDTVYSMNKALVSYTILLKFSFVRMCKYLYWQQDQSTD